MGKTLKVILLALVLSGCSSLNHKDDVSYKERPNTREVHWQEVKWRSQIISDVKYDLKFYFSKKNKDRFNGETTLSFHLKDNSKPLNIDFRDGQIKEVYIQGKSFSKWKYNNYFITLPKRTLVRGQNTVRVIFDAPFSKTGAGLNRIVDKKDGRIYIYSDFQPYDANMMFPSFDQPDLKATYKLQVEAPQSWTVITSVMESEKTKAQNGLRLWTFPESAKFSTYVFPLHVGPYKMWKDRAGKIPIRLFARRSVAKHIRVSDWMKFTKQGFKFFNGYFDYPYPFKKYDQIIAPNYSGGAMENMAAVTYSESRFVRRGVSSRANRRYHAEVLLHELAHMWFGNLVTPKWWNGLWLNESFATYMAVVAMAKATEFKEAWQYFYLVDKGWGYRTDLLSTTHPIEMPVSDTGMASAHGGGITYGKGAAVLKQLSYYVGEKNFRDGIREYFKEHAYKTTSIEEFLAPIAKASGKDLSDWASRWLYTSSVNAVEPQFECLGGEISSFNLKQSNLEGFSTLRPHRTKVATYIKDESGELKRNSVVSVAYSQANTPVSELVGTQCPDLVHTNYDDYDYHLQRLDPLSLETAKTSISQIKDLLTRTMLWNILWEMVVEGQWPATEFLQMAYDNLPTETNLQVINRITLGVRRGLYYMPQKTAEEKDLHMKWVAKFENLFWNLLVASNLEPDHKREWYLAFRRVSQSTNALGHLESLLEGRVKVSGLLIDQDRRWDIIKRLNRFSFKGSKELLSREKKRDNTTRGQKAAISAEAIRPELEAKLRWYNEAVKLENRMPDAILVAALRGILPKEQAHLRKEFSERFFADLTRLKDSTPNFLKRFISGFVPKYCAKESSREILSYVGEKEKELPAIAVKRLKNSAQSAQRCSRAREKVRKSGAGQLASRGR